jgi:hypothetical protein
MVIHVYRSHASTLRLRTANFGYFHPQTNG